MSTRCYQDSNLPEIANYVAIDFTVTWNADMTDIMNYSDSDFDSSNNTDTVLCDILRTDEANMYSSITYTLDDSSTSTTTMAGLARHNVPLFNGLALGSTDAVEGEGDSMD
jgi:hypothetical protein